MERQTSTAERRTGAGDEPARGARHWLAAHRPLVGAVAAVLLAAAAAAGGLARRGSAPDDREQMAHATLAIDSLVQRAWADDANGGPPSLDDAGLVALGYVARAQSGVGSPFRLATLALHDPRLTPALGRAVAWALLARSAHGTVYAVDSTALWSAAGLPAGRQLELIDGAIAAAPDARTGEASVRIAYLLAQLEGLVSAPTTSVATRMAAQRRDHRLAVEDAERLLRASRGDAESDALALLVRWRAERRLMVEQPLLGPRIHADESAAVRGGLALRDSLRALWLLSSHTRDTTATAGSPSRVASGSEVLPPSAARRLAELNSVRNSPPEAPVAVAVAAYRRALTRDGGGVAATRRFAERARNEEALVAELALAQVAGSSAPEIANVGLSAAVAMRAFAQDTLLPSAVGVGAPTVASIEARFGLRAVTFDPSVPAAWRPYYVTSLATALDDLRDVLPWVEFEGLAVRVGESVKRDSALALHDPRSRTLYLPVATGAGTIAHELAHDLDWQTARTRLAIRGTYSTDRSIRDGHGALAASVRGLTAARPGSPSGDASAERPAELFARGVDFFVASTLASTGRMNGALSAVQDETLSGYAGVRPPMAGDGAADALVGVLSDMTVVPEAARDRFIARYGAVGSTTPQGLVRAVAAAPSRWNAERTLRSIGLVGDACVSDRDEIATAASWRTVLLRAAAESRARGMLRSRGMHYVAPARWSWEARATVGGPWNPAIGDSAIARTRDALLRAVAWDDAARHPFTSNESVAAHAARAVRDCR